jgi:hypothetical protein
MEGYMKRLLKQSIGDINKDDIDIKIDEEHISMHIINKEKEKELEKWVYLNETDYQLEQEGLIGLIDYYVYESTINFFVIEVNKAYANTSVTLYLLKEFEDKIINPLINQYGKEEVSIRTNFENMKLKGIIEKICKKKGIEIIDTNSTSDNNKELKVNTLYDFNDVTETSIAYFERSNQTVTLIDDTKNKYIYTSSTVPSDILNSKNFACADFEGTKFLSELNKLDFFEPNGDLYSRIYVSKSGKITSLDKNEFDEFTPSPQNGKYEKVANIKRLKK